MGCGRVFNQHEHPKLDVVGEPCPKCCDVSGARTLWPPYETTLFLKVVDEAVAGNDAQLLRVRALFLASACENMMADILWETMEHMRVPTVVAEQLLDHTRGRANQLQRYQKLVGRKPQQVLSEASRAEWLKAWETLATVRNTYGHGKWRSRRAPTKHGKWCRVSDDEADEAIKLVQASFASAFAALKNAAMDAAQQP